MKTILSILLTLAALCVSLQAQVRFAVIGDFGKASQPELDVANLIKSWNVDFIITTGDNNYEYGEASTIDANIGQYYHDFIFPYTGAYGSGDTINRFFPCPGNHDWIQPNAAPYFSYFTLPGNEHYYDFVRGPVHLFSVDSDPHEPGGINSSSAQATWLRGALQSSTSRWNVVYLHHAPYSSGTRHGSNPTLQWQFKTWGASAVLAGHEHNYERLIEDSLVYFVNGIGGKDLYAFGTPIAGSVMRYNADFGAQLVTASDDSISFELIARTGAMIDRYTLHRNPMAYHFTPGWNLISIPFNPADPRRAYLFPAAGSSAFGYTGSYQVEDSLRHGKGYWLKFLAATDQSLYESPLHIDTIDVLPGWNMIGSIGVAVPKDSVVQLPPGNILSPFFNYEAVYNVADTLFPGKGYWVKTAGEGKIILK